MGSQIGAEWAIAGHQVTYLVKRRDEAERRIGEAFALADSLDLWSPEAVSTGQNRIAFAERVAELDPGTELFLESITEVPEPKFALLKEAANRLPAAILASNTSSISIDILGAQSGAPERMIGVHYWNPPLIMPLVEIISGEKTASEYRDLMVTELVKMGKRPMVVNRNVPGFVWNRLQFALLREAVWIVENGVATPEVVDEIVRDGLARRWRYTGPFATAALGGQASFSRIADNLWPVISSATSIEDLAQWLIDDPKRLAQIKAARDAGLLNDLRNERHQTDRTADAPHA